MLDDVAVKFEEAVAVMDDFMGAPVLAAITSVSGTPQPIITPNTPVNEDGTIAQEIINLWDNGQDDPNASEDDTSNVNV